MNRKIKFLVSVANRREAIEVIKSGVDILDIKNPQEGSLGGHNPLNIISIKKICKSNIKISAAVGDVPYKPGLVSQAVWGLCFCEVDFIKIGLWGVTSVKEGIHLSNEASKAIKNYTKKRISLVIAGYADAHLINSIDPLSLPWIAKKSKAQVVMIDTAIKTNGKNLFSYLGMEELKKFIKLAHKYNLECALAGRLDEMCILKLKETDVDIIGVRSVVCRGDRVKGGISQKKVSYIKNLLNK